MTTKKADAKFAHLYIKELEGKMCVWKVNDEVYCADKIDYIFESETFKGKYELFSKLSQNVPIAIYSLETLKRLADGEVITRKFRNGDISTTYVKNINECTL